MLGVGVLELSPVLLPLDLGILGAISHGFVLANILVGLLNHIIFVLHQNILNLVISFHIFVVLIWPLNRASERS